MTDAHGAQCTVGVVVVAAGAGTRLGAAVPKAFVEVGGRTLLDHALERVLVVPRVTRVAVVVPADYVAALGERWDVARVRVVAGGAERTDSVAAGMTALSAGSEANAPDYVLVHDAARSLAPVWLFTRVIEALDAGAHAVVPGLPVADTIKVVDERGQVRSTPDRSALRAIQTPQGFTRQALVKAHGAGLHATDDAGLAEEAGIPVLVVAGAAEAFKITTPEDLERAAGLVVAASPGRGPARGARPGGWGA